MRHDQRENQTSCSDQDSPDALSDEMLRFGRLAIVPLLLLGFISLTTMSSPSSMIPAAIVALAIASALWFCSPLARR